MALRRDKRFKAMTLKGRVGLTHLSWEHRLVSDLERLAR